MKKELILIVALFSTLLFADDLDLGSDFNSGDSIKADEFNSKFNKLKKLNGEIKDSTLLGAWNCKSYLYYENSGRTNEGDGFFCAKEGVLTLSEKDSSASIDSPKNWETSVTDIIHKDYNATSGKYALIGQTLVVKLQEQVEAEGTYGAWFLINMTSETQFSLVDKTHYNAGSIPFVNCNKQP